MYISWTAQELVNNRLYSANTIALVHKHGCMQFTIIGGLDDELADPDDVARLVSGLREGRDVSSTGVEFWLQPGYAHLDYLWSTSAVSDIYPQVDAH